MIKIPYNLAPDIYEKGLRIINQMHQMVSLREEYLRKGLEEERDIEKINKSFIEYLEEASLDTWDLLLSKYDKYSNFDAIAAINRFAERLGWLKDGELYYKPASKEDFEKVRNDFLEEFKGYFNPDFIEKTIEMIPNAKEDLILYIMMQNLRDKFIDDVRRDIFGDSPGKGLISKINEEFIKNDEWSRNIKLLQEDQFRKITLYLTYLNEREKRSNELDGWIPNILTKEYDTILLRPEHKKIVQVTKDNKVKIIDNIYEDEKFFADIKKNIKKEVPQFFLKIKKYDTLKEFLESDSPYEMYLRVKFLTQYLKDIKFDPVWDNDNTVLESKFSQELLENLVENNKLEAAKNVLVDRLSDLRKTEIPPYLMKKIISSKNKELTAAALLTILSDGNINGKDGKSEIENRMYMYQIEQTYDRKFLSKLMKDKEKLKNICDEIIKKVSKDLGDEKTKEMSKAIKDLFSGKEVKFRGFNKKDEIFTISMIGDVEEILDIPEEIGVWEDKISE
ncbi:MAG: hypothetical protein OH354_03490 [Candidatus Parvarchaeota archaeon]|nr:hypothetical protein [Candidatus Jingweiarchaeum tengchongense]